MQTTLLMSLMSTCGPPAFCGFGNNGSHTTGVWHDMFCLISTQRREFGKVWGQRIPPSHSSSKLFPGGNQARQSGAWVHRGEMLLWGGQGDFCPPTTAGQFQDTNKSIENATTLGTKFCY